MDERQIIVTTAVTAGITGYAVGRLVKNRKQQQALNELYSGTKLLADFCDWVAANGPQMEPEAFMEEMGERLCFIGIAISNM